MASAEKPGGFPCGPEVALHEDEAAGLDGSVCADPHGQAEVDVGQTASSFTPSLTSPRSVALQPPLDGIDLGFGEDLGDDPVAIDIDLGGHAPSGLAVARPSAITRPRTGDSAASRASSKCRSFHTFLLAIASTKGQVG